MTREPSSVATEPQLTPEAIKQAIDLVKEARTVVIYCGAGVSISKTGLNWGSLIIEVFNQLNSIPPVVSLEQQEEFRAYLRATQHQPLQNATLVWHYLQKCAEKSQRIEEPYKKLSDALTEAIYRKASNKANVHPFGGLLLESVTMLVGGLHEAGKQVRIVTTNYDTYLEQPLRQVEEKLSIKIQDLPPEQLDQEYYHQHNKTVPLIYLHGKVCTAKGEWQGKSDKFEADQLVFSEIDYYRRRHQTENALDIVTKDADVVLIVGSSLDDTPLLDWIQKNRDEGHSKVVVIQDIGMEPYAEPSRTEQHRCQNIEMRKSRYTALGVSTLIGARCFADIPIILRNIHRSLSPDTADSTTEDQIANWAQAVTNKLKRQNNKLHLYTSLNKQNETARLLFSSIINTLPTQRGGNRGWQLDTRLELWLRGISEDPARQSIYYLVKVGDSDNITRDDKGRRRESYLRRFPSKSHALRVAQSDSSELISLGDLGQSDSASRWQAFYGVPVRFNFGDEDYRESKVTVGSMILAIRLAESNHTFLNHDDRLVFGKQIKSLSEAMCTGTSTDAQSILIQRLNFVLQKASEEAITCVLKGMKPAS